MSEQARNAESVGGDRRRSIKSTHSARPQTRSGASTFAVGLVLVFGAVWYYFYANTASQTLAERDFRQLNQLAEHANGVLSNFPYLFQFSYLQETDPSVNSGQITAEQCTSLRAPNAELDLLEFLRCRYLDLEKPGIVHDNKSDIAGFAAATQSAADIENMVRDRQAAQLESYYRGLRHNKVLQNLDLGVLNADDTGCTITEPGGSSPSHHNAVVFRLEGTPGNKILTVLDCRALGTGAVDIRKRLVARIPFADLFSPSAVDLDFDQIGVIDDNNEVLFLSTDRIERRNKKIGQMVDTSTFARITKLAIEERSKSDDKKSSSDEGKHRTTILERKLGNIGYKIFVQPHVPSIVPLDNAQSARWSIIGLKQTQRFNAERFPLPAYQFGIFTFALILSIALLPTIRLLFLSQGTSLTRLDFSILIFSLIIATGTAVIMGLMVDTHLKMGTQQRAELERVSRAVNLEFTDEIKRKYTALEAIETDIVRRYAQPTNDAVGQVQKLITESPNRLIDQLLGSLPRFNELSSDAPITRESLRALTFWADARVLYDRIVPLLEHDESLVKDVPGVMAVHEKAHEQLAPLRDIPLENFDPQCWNQQRKLRRTDYPDGDPISPLNFDLAWMIDKSGNQVGSQVSFRNAGVRFISVPNREYFKRAASGRVWKPRWLNVDGRKGVFIERVFSRVGGSRMTIISKPADGPETSPGIFEYKCSPSVAAIATEMDSVVDPVLPAGYSFAIIDDADGTVLYHSDDHLSLIQNFYTETRNNKSLIAATQFDEPDHFTTDYSGRSVQAYVAPLAQIPWSLVVFSDGELNASMTLASAFYAFGLVFIIALATFLAMEALHWRGRSTSRAWWPHREHVRLHAVVIIISAAYAIGLLATLGRPDSKFLVVIALVLGPYLVAAFSLLWNNSSPRSVFIITAPPIIGLWYFNMSIFKIAVVIVLFGGVIVFALQFLNRSTRLAEQFRTVHAFAGVILFTAIVGAPAIVFYADSLSYHLLQEQRLQETSTANDQRSRRIALDAYDRTLAFSVSRAEKVMCFGIYADPTQNWNCPNGDHRGAQASTRGSSMPRIDLFASNIATSVADWINPSAGETAMLRPRTGMRPAGEIGPRAVPIASYINVKIVSLTLFVLALFLYTISRVASRRLFGLQGGGAGHYLEHWPSVPKTHDPRPDIESLQTPALLVGYSPSTADLDRWKEQYVVMSIEQVHEVHTLEKIVVLYGLASGLRERDPEKSNNVRHELERIQREAPRLVVCCEVLPSYWLSHAVDDERAEISGGVRGRNRWLQLLDAYHWYAPPRPKFGDPARFGTVLTSVEADNNSASVAQILREEISAFPELNTLYESLDSRARDLGASEILPVVFHAAHAIYARKWHACTLTEQALLLQIARKELVNPDQYEVIGSLEVRGLVSRDPRIRIANQTFLWFVENASISEELADHSLQYQRNLWQSMRWPVMIVIALFALFLFQVGGEKIELAVGGLGSLLALTTVARQLWTQLRSNSGT